MRRELFVNPGSDAAFRARADDLMRGPISGPDELQAQLRGTYPDAVVRERGLSGETHAVWYVYRDGRWTPPPDGSEGTR